MRRPLDDIITPAERDELTAGYRAETTRLLQAALPSAVLVYFASVGFPVLHEAIFHPERRWLVLAHVVADALFGALTIATVRRTSNRSTILWAGIFFLAAAGAVSGAYNAAVGGRGERFVLREILILNGAALFLPWGPGPQLAGLAGVLLTLTIAGPMMASADDTSYLSLILVMGGVISAGVAAYLDRHRRLAYERGARDREAIAVNATLLAAGQTLVPIEAPDRILEETVRAAVGAVGCDWGAVFTWDGEAERHRLAASHGLEPAEQERLHALPPSPTAAADRPGDAAHTALTSSWGASALIVATLSASDTHAPLLACGWRQTAHPLPRRCHRLAQGFADAGALALDGARVVDDLRRTNRLKSEFVSTISHEMRTPLNVILGNIEMGRDPDLPDDERSACLERADAAGRQLLLLIEDALDVGRLGAGTDDPELEAIELPALWGVLRAQCAALPHPPRVRLLWDDAVAPGLVATDPRKLGVIVRNLVQNALKFTVDGEVRVDVQRAGNDMILRVADTGIGIAPEQHATAFELFRQGDGSDARRYGGIGLGLYIVRRFVDQLGGRITLESTPGRGTTFTVQLPADASALQRQAS